MGLHPRSPGSGPGLKVVLSLPGLPLSVSFLTSGYLPLKTLYFLVVVIVLSLLKWSFLRISYYSSAHQSTDFFLSHENTEEFLQSRKYQDTRPHPHSSRMQDFLEFVLGLFHYFQTLHLTSLRKLLPLHPTRGSDPQTMPTLQYSCQIKYRFPLNLKFK